MTDISVTAASVIASSNAHFKLGTAGESLSAGQPLFKDATDASKMKRTIANVSAAEANCDGIALHAAATGQPIVYADSGDLNIGATLVVGQEYIISSTRGGIAPVSDLTTGWFTTVLGIATSASNLRLNINAGGTAKA